MNHLLAVVLLVGTMSCKPAEKLKHQLQSGPFTYFADERDSSVVRDISVLMDSASDGVSRNLGVVYKHPVTVEVYPTQEEFNANIMNPLMRGTPAVSGAYRIQMVSPASPIALQGIPYRERLWFAVHEFTHLVIDQISEDVPAWLDEGLACYEGSFMFYSYVCHNSMPESEPPTLTALTGSYERISAADVYSFSLVEFLIRRYGRAKINHLLREPQEIQKVFGVSPNDIREQWKVFISSNHRTATH